MDAALQDRPEAPSIADASLCAGPLAQDALGAWAMLRLARQCLRYGDIENADAAIRSLAFLAACVPAPLARRLSADRAGLCGGVFVLRALHALIRERAAP